VTTDNIKGRMCTLAEEVRKQSAALAIIAASVKAHDEGPISMMRIL